jgi:hypothetical protein
MCRGKSGSALSRCHKQGIGLPRNSRTFFDSCCEMSMPISRITSTASGCNPRGVIPALSASKRSLAMSRRKASAIWLRAELPVQRKRTFGFSIVDDYNGRVWCSSGGGCPPQAQRGELGAAVNAAGGRVSRTAIHARIVPCNTPVARFAHGSAFGQVGKFAQNASGAVRANPPRRPPYEPVLRSA